MKLIIGGRDTGKTKRLLEYAAQNNATVITSNARALRVKAQAYGLNVEIDELESYICKPHSEVNHKIVIHEMDKYNEWHFHNLGYELIGGTLTQEGEQ